MKTKSLLILPLLLLGLASPAQAIRTQGPELLGVWKLKRFVTEERGAPARDWCPGVNGTLTYLPTQHMTVALNCLGTETGSQAEALGGKLFYSGPFEFDAQRGEVIHRARNFSHPSLNRVQRRQVTMRSPDELTLTGDLGEGRRVTLDWVREEKFAYDNEALSGIWELVGSRNQVGARADVPFCTGFYGTILFTPGGHAAVSINCGAKPASVGQEPADMFGRRYFYDGRFTVRDDVLEVIPTNASEAGDIGRPVLRAMKITGDILTLEGTNGSKFVAEWRKLGGFVGLAR